MLQEISGKSKLSFIGFSPGSRDTFRSVKGL
jgi:hypothetical protein